MHEAIQEYYKHVEELIEDKLELVCFIESTKGPQIKYSAISTFMGKLFGKPPRPTSPPESIRHIGISKTSGKVYVFDRYQDGTLKDVKTFSPNRMDKIRLVKLERAIGLVFKYKGKDHQYKLLEYPLTYGVNATNEHLDLYKSMARQIAGLLKAVAKMQRGQQVPETQLPQSMVTGAPLSQAEAPVSTAAQTFNSSFESQMPESHIETSIPESQLPEALNLNDDDDEGEMPPTPQDLAAEPPPALHEAAPSQSSFNKGADLPPSIPPPPGMKRVLTRDGKRSDGAIVPSSDEDEGTHADDEEGHNAA